MRFYLSDFAGKEKGHESGFHCFGAHLHMSQNAFTFNTVQSVPPLVDPTLYASPLLTLSKHGYTKHYFEEGRRICSKIGGGFDAGLGQDIERPVGVISGSLYILHEQQRMSVQKTFTHDMNMEAGMEGVHDLSKVVMNHELGRDDPEPAFFYHSDHLGSAAYITDEYGQWTQMLNYLPYGEDWVERNRFNPADTTRLGIYRFNGKEKDHETGFHYYGARYYWSELLTGWLSVDPMADKYPSMSPYNYCMWNPVKLIDPDGRDNVIYLVNLQGNNQKVNVNKIIREANRYFSEMGLSTRVMMAPDGQNFNPAYIDKTDSYAVLGSHADVSAYLNSHMQPGKYKEHFSDWAGGTSNPERSSRSLYNKTNAIALDADGINNSAKLWGESSSTMGAFLIMHGAGHNATLGHADNVGDDNHRSNMGNARIMASGNRIFRSGQSLDYFMGKDNNSVYISVMQEKFGLNPAVDNYHKNKNPNAFNPYTNCSTY